MVVDLLGGLAVSVEIFVLTLLLALPLGVPIALQDVLVGVSFLVILAIVNSLGLLQSAGMGIAEKVCAFGVRIPVSFFMSRLPNVRLFYIGLATPKGTFCRALDLGKRRRDRIQDLASNHAFDVIRRYLTGLPI